MIRKDDATWILEQLEQLASKLGIAVRYEFLGGPDSELHLRSGTCRLRGRQLIIIDRHQPREEQCRALAAELKHFDLSKVFITPAIRGLLEE
jgi:hypothetical protein